MKTEYENMTLDIEDGVALLTLNREEKYNAMTTSMYHTLGKIASELEKDDSTKAFIITGKGKGFCSGSDRDERLMPRVFGEKKEVGRWELTEPLGSFLVPLYEMKKPKIAAINGFALGAGLSIALLCDFRIASKSAKFGAVWIKVGLCPDVGASYILPRLVGVEKALELVLTGRIIDADEAFKIGLVGKVVSEDKLLYEAKSLAIELAKGPSVAIELSKRLIYKSLDNTFLDQLYLESFCQNICFSTQDFKEAVCAFKEKRNPKFKGS